MRIAYVKIYTERENTTEKREVQIMKLKIYSRKDLIHAVKCHDIDSKTAVISFYDKETEPVSLDGTGGRVFSVELNDLDISELKDAYYHFFDEASEAAEFVIRAVNDGCTLIFQCECGMSRSAGCAAAVTEFFEGSSTAIFADPKYCPNLAVFHKMYYALCCARLKLTDIDTDKYRNVDVAADRQVAIKRLLAIIRREVELSKNGDHRSELFGAYFITNDGISYSFEGGMGSFFTAGNIEELLEKYAEEDFLFVCYRMWDDITEEDSESGRTYFMLGNVGALEYFELIDKKYNVREEIVYD